MCHRPNLAAALRRVNKQLAAWDLLDALELLPNSLRPTIEPPRLSREQLKSSQVESVEAVRESELASDAADTGA